MCFAYRLKNVADRLQTNKNTHKYYKIASYAAYHPKNTETKQIAEIAAFAVGKQNITIFNLTFVLNARADAPTISLFPTI